MTARGADAQGSKLVARASIVGAGTLVSRVLGLGRDVALAALFTRDATDAFFVAFTIPNVLRQLLGEGAVSSAVVPVLSETLAQEGDEAAQRLFQRLRGLSLAALVVVTVLGMTFARPLCLLFADGYRERPQQLERTVTLTRIVFPYIFFMGTAALGMAALNAKQRFVVSSFAPGLLNVAFLVAAFALPPVLAGYGVDVAYAMGIGALVGGALQVVAQWPSLKRIGYLRRPIFDGSDPGVRRVLRRLLPMTFGIGIYYVDIVLSRRFLSEMEPGAQSYFTWANRLCDLPQGLFSLAIATATLPTLSTLFAAGDRGAFAREYVHGVRLSLFVAVPCSFALVFLAEPLVVALFQRGHFDGGASLETSRALLWQGGAVWTVAVVRQVVPAFHAMGDTRTPVLVSALDLVAFLALAYGLRGPMGHAGVSVAVAGSSFVQMVLLLAALQRRLGGDAFRGMASSVLRTTVASSVAAGAAWSAARLGAAVAGGGGVAAASGSVAGAAAVSGAGALARIVPGTAGAAVFGGTFLLAAWGLRAPELEEVVTTVVRRVRRAR